jgi:GH35 family endo-1,4-beta-xylanase
MRQFLTAVVILGACSAAWADDSLNANSLIFQSQGTQVGTSYTLGNTFKAGASTLAKQDGYVGTYINVTTPTAVTFTANAAGTASAGLDPDMTISIANYNKSFDVSATSNYSFTTPVLQAGTYFVRTQLDNQNNTQTPALTINSLAVTGSGVTFSNSNTGAGSSDNALNASDTYIANFRQGTHQVQLLGTNNQPLAQGTQVTIHMNRNAFNFGTNVSGNDDTSSTAIANGTTDTAIKGWLADPNVAGSGANANAAVFQAFVNAHFNTLVGSNVGKWGETADNSTGNTPVMNSVDDITHYAQTHDDGKMTVRMHNVIWGNQQPTFVNTDLTNAQSANATTKANAIAALNAAITNRINNYYVSGNGAAAGSKDTITNVARDTEYSQLDVLNESLNTAPYWKILGASGVANIYAQVQAAVASDGGHVELETNEYNVLQNSPALVNTSTQSGIGSKTTATGNDDYANWYRKNVDDLNNAGFGKVVTGVGIQYYALTGHSNSRMMKAMENMDVTGLPIGLNEFGMASTDTDNAADVVTQTFRMFYGNPNANTAMIWGWFAGATGTAESASVLENTDGTLTAAGVAFVNLLNSWTTPDQTMTVGANGMVDMSGFYGNYDILSQDGLTNLGNFDFAAAPEPSIAALLALGMLASRRLSRHTIPLN